MLLSCFDDIGFDSSVELILVGGSFDFFLLFTFDVSECVLSLDLVSVEAESNAFVMVFMWASFCMDIFVVAVVAVCLVGLDVTA